MPRGAPALSVCIPTHHGRAAELRVAIASVLDPLAAGLGAEIEICVSDNASRDPTRAVVAEAEARGLAPIRYARSEEDRGPARNIDAAVRLARAPWVWLLSSDDALAPEALTVVLGALSRHPQAAGLSVDRANLDRELTALVVQDPPGFAPPDPGIELWSASEVVLRRLGSLFRYLSSHVVRRDAWCAVVDREPPWETTRFYPQLLVLARVVQAHGAWIWVGRKLVRNRTRNLSVHDVLGPEEEVLHSVLPADVERCWAALAGRRSPLYRELTALELELTAPPDILLALKRGSARPWRTDARLLAYLGRAFWRRPRFWRAQVPVLLTPAVVVRRRGARRLAPSLPIAPTEGRARLAVTPPTRLRCRHQTFVRCAVENRGPATLSTAPPDPVHLSYRWTDPSSGALVADGLRTPLPGPLPPGARTIVPLRVVAPWAAGPATLRISLVQERVAWWEDVDAAHGVAAMVDVTE